MKPRNTVNNIHPYIPGKAIQEVIAEYGLDAVTKMASNENPLGSSVSWEQLQKTFSEIHLYPHQASSPVIPKLCSHLNITSDHLILGNGSDEIIQLLTQAYLNPGDNIVISKPTFSVYESAAAIMDAVISEKVTEKTKLIFIANPNNPTGTFKTNSELTTLLENTEKHILVVIDEAYCEYATHPDFPKTLELQKKYQNLVVLRTFSKLYGLAGLRLGYGIAHPIIIQTLQKICPPFNVNSLSLVAGALALDNKSHVKNSLELNAAGKEFFYCELDKMGLEYHETQANFVCIKLPIEAKKCMQEFLRKGIIIRPLESFGLPHSIRVTIGTKKDNEYFFQCLKEILK
jgi:histidinol-phosphate aminotransferase